MIKMRMNDGSDGGLLRKGGLLMGDSSNRRVLSARLLMIGVLIGSALAFMTPDGRIALAQMQKAPDLKANVFTPYDQPIGAVDNMGNVFALSGTQIGKVDPDGTVYNVSNVVVGKVEPDGKVKNQSGTVLCTVTSDGSVFNVSGTVIGSVKETGGNLRLIGGAARLLVLRRR
jgi:hypothetical protein